MGLFNSHEQKIIPLEINQGTINMFEVEQLSHRIQSTINQCHFERELIKNKYGINPDTVELSSCTSTFKYYGHLNYFQIGLKVEQRPLNFKSNHIRKKMTIIFIPELRFFGKEVQ